MTFFSPLPPDACTFFYQQPLPLSTFPATSTCRLLYSRLAVAFFPPLLSLTVTCSLLLVPPFTCSHSHTFHRTPLIFVCVAKT